MRTLLMAVMIGFAAITPAFAQEGETATPNAQTDYPALASRIEKVMESALYAQEAFEHPRTQYFLLDLKRTAATATTDKEILEVVRRHRERLPFTHFSLRAPRRSPAPGAPTKPKSPKPEMTLEEREDGVFVMTVPNFNTGTVTVDGIAAAFERIVEADATGVIIDLRTNPGGTYSSGYLMAHLIDEPVTGGALFARPAREAVLSMDWSPFPEIPVQDINSIAHLAELVGQSGAILYRVEPRGPRYRGPVKVLTSFRTGSANEPLIYGLRDVENVEVIGEPTGGAMLSGFPQDVGQGWRMVVPVLDYIADDGVRLDKRGVMPDIVVHRDEALDVALARLNDAQ